MAAYLRYYSHQQPSYYDNIAYEELGVESKQALRDAHGAIITILTQDAGRHARSADHDRRVSDTMEARVRDNRHFHRDWENRIEDWVKARCRVSEVDVNILLFDALLILSFALVSFH